MKVCLALILVALGAAGLQAQEAPQLNLPPRAPDALTGSQIAQAVGALPLHEREERLFQEITGGNIPSRLRTLKPVTLTNGNNHFTAFVTSDYLAVGNDTDYLRTPLTPMTAQRIANLLACSLPTPAVVDAIWHAADVKLAPEPMSPGPEMTTVAAFARHHALIQQQLGSRSGLIAGHKKDVVAVSGLTNRVALYGWHQTNGVPIQPLYTRHAATWVDYSHGIRLVWNQPTNLVAADMSPLHLNSGTGPSRTAAWVPTPTRQLDELETEFTLSPEVRVRLNLPPASPEFEAELLVLYALPNGNTIEQTAGRRPHNTNEWRYDIQHIAAQIRFVRAALPETRIGLAYLEATGLSWPAWRKRNGNDAIPGIIEAVHRAFSTNNSPFVLSAHSGGGSLLFGYVAAVTNLPAELTTLAFLDATYAYDPAQHRDKLKRWLKTASRPRLTVFAYEDHVALLNGKPFVSATGGTWGRSQLMLEDLRRDFTYTSQTNNSLQTHRAEAGRVEFRLRENPERKIWHTLLVERNGFIHALLTGTPALGRDCEFLGSRSYEKFISEY